MLEQPDLPPQNVDVQAQIKAGGINDEIYRQKCSGWL